MSDVGEAMRAGDRVRRDRRLARARRPIAVRLVALGLGLAVMVGADGGSVTNAGQRPPTVILIVTDDQRADSLWAMPYVSGRFSRVRFARAFVVNPLCCPSRTSILTGNYSHTTGVWDNLGSHGGFGAFQDGSTMGTWFDAGGYETAFVGKYLNGYLDPGYVPPGWDRWVSFVGGQGAYYDYSLSVDGLVEEHGDRSRDYSTDVLADHAVEFVQETPNDRPLFLLVAPFAPHSTPRPAARHQGAYRDVEFRRTRAINERDVSDKPAYIRRLRPVRLRRLERTRRRKLETLLAVDEMIARIVSELRDADRFDDAVIAFTSDNGMAEGEHRWTYKVVPYEESIRVPLSLGGGGIPRTGRVGELAANIDIAPTLAELAAVGIPQTDGVNLVPAIMGSGTPRDDVLVERTHYDHGGRHVPAYCALRTRGRLFVRYESGFEELYNLQRDPHELGNRAAINGARPTLRRLRARTRDLCQPLPPGMHSF